MQMVQHLRFGAGPKPRLSVNPQWGEVGTVFRFNAVNFDPHTAVNVEITNGNGHHIYAHQITTDENGSIGHFGLAWPTAGWPRGIYHFAITGWHQGKSVPLVQRFDLT